jgi:hypothetical protein
MEEMQELTQSMQSEIDMLRNTMAKINKIAEDARNGVPPADWREAWQRNEWTKVRDLTKHF